MWLEKVGEFAQGSKLNPYEVKQLNSRNYSYQHPMCVLCTSDHHKVVHSPLVQLVKADTGGPIDVVIYLHAYGQKDICSDSILIHSVCGQVLRVLFCALVFLGIALPSVHRMLL